MIRPVIVMFIQITRMFDRFFAILFAATAISAHGQEPCLLFDGMDDQVTVPNAVLNNIGTGTFTVEAWVRGVESQQPTHPRILSNRDVTNNGFMFGVHGVWGGSAYKMLCMQLDGMNYILINNGSYNGSILDGSCHHVAVSKDTDSLRFYVDGAHIGSKVLQGDPSAATSAVNMLIGNDAPDPQPFNGNIAQVRLWNGVRTQEQIVTDMNYSIPGTTPGLAGYWELNEGSGQAVIDKTTTTNGVLGSGSGTEGEDPVWTSDCCAIGTGNAVPDGPAIPGLHIHPVPVNDVLAIELPVPNAAAELIITDAAGRSVHSGRTDGRPSTMIDLSHLPAGAYVLHIRTRSNVYAEHFVKN